MGLKWESSEDTEVISNLKKNMSAANEFASDLSSRVNAVVAAVGDGELSGSSYNAAKSLFQELFLPIGSAISNLTNDINDKINTYDSAKGLLNGSSRMDEASLEKAVQSLKELNKQLDSGINKLNPFSTLTIQFNNKRIKDLNEKIERLHTFNSKTSNLFDGSESILGTIVKGLKYIDSGSLSANGSFQPGNNTNLEWLNKLTKYNQNAMKSKSGQIAMFMSAYGLSKSQATKLYDLEGRLDKYAKKKGWSEKYEAFMFAKIIASTTAEYKKTKWQVFAGTFSSNKELKKFLMNALDYKSGQANRFINEFDNEHKTPKLTDFVHTMGSIAIVTNPDFKGKLSRTATSDFSWGEILSSGIYLTGSPTVATLIGNISSQATASNKKSSAAIFSTYGGDIATNSFSKTDIRSDFDALNLIDKISSNPKGSFAKTFNDYGKDIGIDHKNRINIYAHSGNRNGIKDVESEIRSNMKVLDPASSALVAFSEDVKPQNMDKYTNKFIEKLRKLSAE